MPNLGYLVSSGKMIWNYLRNSVAWIVVVSFATTTAVWQAQPSIIRLSQSSRPPQPPAKIRHAVRPLAPRDTVDLAADYFERCHKGLTPREIQWILDDFINAGLDRDPQNSPPEEQLAHRRAQCRWYHDALKEGLHLSREQSAQVMAKLAERLSDAETGFEPDDPTLQPWNLCDPTPAQEEITRKCIPEPWTNETSIPPNAAKFRSAGTVFPFSDPLPFPTDENPLEMQVDHSAELLISQICCLHPVQLKMLLLFEPARTMQIHQAMEFAEP